MPLYRTTGRARIGNLGSLVGNGIGRVKEWLLSPSQSGPSTDAAQASPMALPRELIATAETLLIAAAGGLSFHGLGFPGGLVAGSMLAVAAAALAGRPMRVPPILARPCFVVVGILLGAIITPETLVGIATWPLSVAVLLVSATCMFTATACYLH